MPEPEIAGEDCLNLNVWTPSRGARGLPVLVWIHGGAFVRGSGAVSDYDGARVRPGRRRLRDDQLPPRRGGFLLLGRTAPAEPRPARPGRGAAWVQDNIAAFGGDPGT